MDALGLREVISRAIQTGALPAQDPIMAWGSWSGGGVCGGCDEPIAPDTAEIGLEFLLPGRRFVCVLHPRCWLAWEEIRTGRTEHRTRPARFLDAPDGALYARRARQRGRAGGGTVCDNTAGRSVSWRSGRSPS